MMQSKRLFLVLVILIPLVGAAAFIAGMFLNHRTGPVALRAPLQGDFRSIIIPAPELPTSLPDVVGPVMERQDNTITVEAKSLEGSGMVAASPANTKNQSGPLMEILITSKTVIYRETTRPNQPFSAENQTIQQTVEQTTLDNLNSHSMIMAWGRKSGDRIIADVLMYSDITAVKSAIFEDCEICP